MKDEEIVQIKLFIKTSKNLTIVQILIIFEKIPIKNVTYAANT